MPLFIKSSPWMTFFWIGCSVMGFVYLIGFWNGQGSPAFIVSQVALGIVGVIRERYIQTHLRDRSEKI